MSSAARIVGGLPCVGCGYSLRGLGVADRCPECAAPAEESARDHLVMLAEPELAGLRRATILLVVAGLAPIGTYLLIVAAVLLTMFASSGHPSRLMETFFSAALVAVAIIAPIVGTLGWRRIGELAVVRANATTISQTSGNRTQRAASRLRLLASLFGLAAPVTVVLALVGMNSMRGGWEWWLTLLPMLGALWSVRNASGLNVVADLARRASVLRLSASARFWRRFAQALVVLSLIAGGVVIPLSFVSSPILRSTAFDIAGRMIVWLTIAGMAIALVANIAIALSLWVVLARVRRLKTANGAVFIGNPGEPEAADAVLALSPSP